LPLGASNSHVDLDLLAEDGGTIHLFGGIRGRVLGVEGDEGIAFSGVVGVGHRSVFLELGLELRVGDGLVDSVDEELAALFSVWGHGGGGGVSHSLSSRSTTGGQGDPSVRG